MVKEEIRRKDNYDKLLEEHERKRRIRNGEPEPKPKQSKQPEMTSQELFEMKKAQRAEQ